MSSHEYDASAGDDIDPCIKSAIGTAAGIERFTAARAAALPLGVVGVALVSRGQFDVSHLSGLGSAAVILRGRD